jgi:1-acyl-sn-glycerol-3-phosphate acyltransferase
MGIIDAYSGPARASTGQFDRSSKAAGRTLKQKRGEASGGQGEQSARAGALSAVRVWQSSRARRLLSTLGWFKRDGHHNAESTRKSALAAFSNRRVPLTATTLLRLVCLIVTLLTFLAVLGPPLRIAQICGSRVGRRIPVLFNRLICTGLRVRVRRHGPFSAAAKQLIVANHVSWLDIPVLGSLEPMCFLAKQEIGDHRASRGIVSMQGVIYVDRSRRSCIPFVNVLMAEAIGTGSPVVLFAEGTTSDGNRILPFRSSHFEAVRLTASSPDGDNPIIQPVYIAYTRLAGLPIGRGERPYVAWYGDMTFLPHFFQFVRRGTLTCDVYFGTPIQVSPCLDRKSAARLAEASVRGLATRARQMPEPTVFRRETSPTGSTAKNDVLAGSHGATVTERELANSAARGCRRTAHGASAHLSDL